jgi:two-component sensor histidine kinase
MMQLIKIPSSKRSSSEARLLLREYSHRINNEFASAIGAISVAAAHSANNEAKAVLAAVQDQLQNYAQVHHALQLPEHSSRIDVAAYLQQLCQAITHKYSKERRNAFLANFSSGRRLFVGG